ncbi:MAG TPA: UDP-N-acetylmuramate:L-alanyl-gamma-D-glutamyl-meso-diaminopimelate ligase [Candidatus Tectomicrobia bacterium]|nr:UDP-N-acetylmuramate:L-alanyl-gamma-D-glutamyl-meso-diaminopimelate ligase [Candidatus Tectomicrobia bacterium]
MSDSRHIHLIAICGVGMSALAGMLQARGFRVTGSDQNVYPPMSTQLEALGIELRQGFSPEHLADQPDLIVVGNAVSRSNPEVQAMLERGLPFLSFPQALAEFFLQDRHPIVVVGTHGKTTTASLMAWILETAGLDPSYMIGGLPRNFAANYKLGSGAFFVIEGDEYDTAFFDKGPKFLHYRPRSAILTSIEFDHADIYRDLEHVQEAFRRFTHTLPSDGYLAAGVDFPHVAGLLPAVSCAWEGYGFSALAQWRASDETWGNGGGHFVVHHRGQMVGSMHWELSGRHNIQNALGVIAVASHLGVPLARIQQGLETFAGVKRRQEVRGVVRDITLIDDFAHHPTAIRETLAALRARYAGRRLWAIFEPRSATSRRATFQEDFVEAFAHADRVVIAGLFNPDAIPPESRLSPERLAEDIARRWLNPAVYLPHVDAIVKHVAAEARAGDVMVVMSNGGFGGIQEKLLDALRASPPTCTLPHKGGGPRGEEPL